MTDTYEGWSNRETWAANLWLSNDEGLYNHIRGMAGDALAEAEGEDHFEGLFTTEQIARRILADGLEGLFDGWSADMVEGEETAREMRMMLVDIGSLYRIDWQEVAEGWIASAIEEAGAES